MMVYIDRTIIRNNSVLMENSKECNATKFLFMKVLDLFRDTVPLRTYIGSRYLLHNLSLLKLN